MGYDKCYEKIIGLFLKKKFYMSFFIILPLFFTIFAFGPSFVLLEKMNSALRYHTVSKEELTSIYNFAIIWTLVTAAGALFAGIVVAYSILRPVKKLLREGTGNIDEFSLLGKDFTKMASSFRQYFTILENISGGIITIDKKATIKMANRQACNILECTQKDFIGRNLKDKIGEIDVVIEKVFKNKVESGDIIYKVNGREKVIGYSVSPITVSTGVEGAVFSLKDNTGIKQIREKMKHAERLASIGTLVREMAHEVRNPLAAMKGITQMIYEDMSEQDTKKIYIEEVMKEIDRLNRVVDNLLAKEKIETVSIKEMLHRIVLLCSQKEKMKNLRVIEEYDETIEIYNIDERLSQAFYNVILNAFESADKDGEIIIRSKNDKNKAVIEVISSSVIDKDIVNRIFEEGFTTKANGHGMGLKIAADIISNTGGQINVESSEKNTKFSIILLGGAYA